MMWRQSPFAYSFVKSHPDYYQIPVMIVGRCCAPRLKHAEHDEDEDGEGEERDQRSMDATVAGMAKPSAGLITARRLGGRGDAQGDGEISAEDAETAADIDRENTEGPGLVTLRHQCWIERRKAPGGDALTPENH